MLSMPAINASPINRISRYSKSTILFFSLVLLSLLEACCSIKRRWNTKHMVPKCCACFKVFVHGTELSLLKNIHKTCNDIPIVVPSRKLHVINPVWFFEPKLHARVYFRVSSLEIYHRFPKILVDSLQKKMWHLSIRITKIIIWSNQCASSCWFPPKKMGSHHENKNTTFLHFLGGYIFHPYVWGVSKLDFFSMVFLGSTCRRDVRPDLHPHTFGRWWRSR